MAEIRMEQTQTNLASITGRVCSLKGTGSAGAAPISAGQHAFAKRSGHQ